MRPRTKKLTTIEEAGLAEIWTPRTFIGLTVCLVVFGLLMWGILRYSSKENGPFRSKYEGRIVEKWAGYGETDIGSQPYFRLLIENDYEQRFTVAVLPEIYQRAEVGMRIKKTETGVELITDESKASSVDKLSR